MNKYFLFLSLFLPMKGMQLSRGERTFFSRQPMERESSAQEQLYSSILVYKDNIIAGIKNGEIDLLPFQSLNREELLNVIREFDLDRSLLGKWQYFIDNYTILIWQDKTLYPLFNPAKEKLPLLKTMQEDVGENDRLFLPLNLNTNNDVMDEVLAFASLSDYKKIQKKFAEVSTNIIPIMKVMSFFECIVPLKICTYLFCKEQQHQMPYFLRNVLISEEDLKEWEQFPKIKTELLENYIPKFAVPLKSLVWLRENPKEQVKVLDLNNNCLSQLTKTENAHVILLSHNNLNSIRLMPQNMDGVMILDLSHNNFNFNDWDLKMPDLLFLNAAHNNITELEAGWARDFKDVILLDLSYNKLGNAIFVPGWTWGFEGYIDKEGVARGGLKWLNLSNNGIKVLHKGWAKGLKKLKVLDLSGNPLEKVEKGWSQGLDGLQYLILPQNIKPEIKNQINWELNTIPAFLFGRQPVKRVTII